MSDPVNVGHVDASGDPLVELFVRTPGSQGRHRLEAVLDTGFSGFLAFPRGMIEKHVLPRVDAEREAHKFAAIDVATGDFEVSEGQREATQQLLARCPEAKGRIWYRRAVWSFCDLYGCSAGTIFRRLLFRFDLNSLENAFTHYLSWLPFCYEEPPSRPLVSRRAGPRACSLSVVVQ